MTETNRRRGIIDREDQIQFSSEFSSAMKYMAEHNPIEFFMFIDRIDLAREMLLHEELNRKTRAIGKMLVRRRKAKKGRQKKCLHGQVDLIGFLDKSDGQLLERHGDWGGKKFPSFFGGIKQPNRGEEVSGPNERLDWHAFFKKKQTDIEIDYEANKFTS